MEGEQSKKPLDPLVKTALALCISLIVITVVGMVLTAPDRSIPPYSVMAQQGEIVTVNVPPGTADPDIEALLVRFQTVGHGDRTQFARLKIKPTTPGDPAGLYQRVTIYVFDNPGLAEEASLKEYLSGRDPLARAASNVPYEVCIVSRPTRNLAPWGSCRNRAQRARDHPWARASSFKARREKVRRRPISLTGRGDALGGPDRGLVGRQPRSKPARHQARRPLSPPWQEEVGLKRLLRLPEQAAFLRVRRCR